MVFLNNGGESQFMILVIMMMPTSGRRRGYNIPVLWQHVPGNDCSLATLVSYFFVARVLLNNGLNARHPSRD